MVHPCPKLLGQVALIYLAIAGSAAQDAQPGRATFAEMVAFSSLGSVAWQRLAPDVEGFHALRAERHRAHQSPDTLAPHSSGHAAAIGSLGILPAVRSVSELRPLRL